MTPKPLIYLKIYNFPFIGEENKMFMKEMPFLRCPFCCTGSHMDSPDNYQTTYDSKTKIYL